MWVFTKQTCPFVLFLFRRALPLMQGIVSVHIHTALENPHMIRKVLFLFEKIFCWQTEHLKTFQGVLYFYSCFSPHFYLKICTNIFGVCMILMREKNFPSIYNAYLWEEKMHMQKLNDINSSFFILLHQALLLVKKFSLLLVRK